MITRKIKSRFRRDHLIKLAKELLQEDLSSLKKDGKWFTLRQGHSVEELADAVSFKESLPYRDDVDSKGRRWHTVYLVFIYRQRNWRGDIIECEKKIEFAEDDHWDSSCRGRLVRGSWTDEVKKMTFEQQLDLMIKHQLMRNCEHIIKDNSAINIYI